MSAQDLLLIADEVKAALSMGQAVVALESTVIAHGLPWPLNLETARAMEEMVRSIGAVPATIAILEGQPLIGLQQTQLEFLAKGKDILKASRRDLGYAMGLRRSAATTVASTMFLANLAGIKVFATGGIGGAHRDTGQPWDISADLMELSSTPVAVVCAGAKSILDIPRTLEILETHGVPVLGYGIDDFPAFYCRSSGEPVSARVNTVAEIAAVVKAHWQLCHSGIVIAQPIDDDMALDDAEMAETLQQIELEAAEANIRGRELTPFLLAGVAKATGGRSLQANQALLLANAKLAAEIAKTILDFTP